MDRLYIIIPAYNEQDTIKDVVDEWYPMAVMAGEESRLVVIDDGSKDATLSVLKEEAESKPQLIVKHKENSGHGATILMGYRYAVREGADYIFQTDSDGQTRPEEFPAFWEERSKYDMIVGHRSKREDGFSRIVVTRVLRFVILCCFHVWVTDANTPFRLMKVNTLQEEMKYIPKDYFLANVLITVIYTKRGHRVKYVPITFRPRQGGVNSINMKKIFGIGRQAVRDFRKINKVLSRGV